ncbi:MAG: hypothetical protein NZM44_05510, partial [Candidatus Calescibacterium sp.]|nr:hypothetical protein [Candidatus Calescibacterium sp.]
LVHKEIRERINAHVSATTMISWFFTLQTPDQGGELWVLDNEYENLNTNTMDNFVGREEYLSDNHKNHLLIRTEPGSLLIFKGGSYWHKVIPPEPGNKERITLGGFMALSHDNSTWYYWS